LGARDINELRLDIGDVMDIQAQLAEHIRLTQECERILTEAIELSEAGKIAKAVSLQRQALEILRVLNEMEDR
jgi:hypothetical protein